MEAGGVEPPSRNVPRPRLRAYLMNKNNPVSFPMSRDRSVFVEIMSFHSGFDGYLDEPSLLI